MKNIQFLGNSLDELREFPCAVRQRVGWQLDKLQRGERPDDCKSMPAIGKGVEELRVWDESGTYRVIYIARIRTAIYVLHAFQKKTQATSKRDIEIARARLSELSRGE